MATTTPNYGWSVPTSTDLVKDGATAIETLGDSIDASFVGLKGGTTGQVLSKTSGTDLAFTWVAQDDSNAIQNAIVDAKGDLIGATANDTPARLAVGTNGQILTADSTAATGLKWATATSGGMTLLSTTTLSGATTTISSIDQTYINLFLEIQNVNPSVDNMMEIKPNNTANLCYGVGLYNFGGTIGTESAGTNGNIPVAYYDASNTNNQYSMYINNYTSTTSYKSIEWYGSYMHGAGTQVGDIQAGGLLTNSAITSLVFITTGGTFNGGTIKLYGVK
jgi:hypothetical protein